MLGKPQAKNADSIKTRTSAETRNLPTTLHGERQQQSSLSLLSQLSLPQNIQASRKKNAEGDDNSTKPKVPEV